MPLCLFAPGYPLQFAPHASGAPLAHISATVLHLLGLQAPEDYASSLIAR